MCKGVKRQPIVQQIIAGWPVCYSHPRCPIYTNKLQAFYGSDANICSYYGKFVQIQDKVKDFWVI
jgi:hypothetical protein